MRKKTFDRVRVAYVSLEIATIQPPPALHLGKTNHENFPQDCKLKHMTYVYLIHQNVYKMCYIHVLHCTTVRTVKIKMFLCVVK